MQPEINETTDAENPSTEPSAIVSTPDRAAAPDVQKLTESLTQQGKWEEASNLLREALTASPEDAAIHHSLGFVLARQGELAEAEQHFNRALQQQPDRIETLRNLALCLSQQGKHRSVLEVSRRLIALQPENPTFWHELGRVNRRLKELDAAIAAFEKAIALQSSLADAHHDLGLALADQGDHVRAAVAYRESLAIHPNFVEALNNLGVLLEEQGKVDEAVDLLRRAVQLKQAAPDLWNNLGVALAAKREFTEAILCYQRALQLDPRYAAALNNLGNAQRSIGEIEASIRSLRQSLRIRPDYAEAYNNLAIALVQDGRHQEAMRYYDQAIHFRPDYPEAHMNRSLDRLAIADFEAGWIEYEWRWRGKQLRLRYPDRLRWDGSSPAGKRILIHFEQGLGDTIQFIRYGRLLKKLGATVLAEVQAPLVKLLQGTECVDELFAGGAPPPFDFHAPLLSLPGLLGTTLPTIPADVSYLQPDRRLVEMWRSRLAQLPGFRIGIAWQGNPEYRGDRHRSVPLRHFASLARIPGVTLISLQKGYSSTQHAELRDSFPLIIFDELDTATGPFMDTAAIIQNLDLVVTSDTALPHLAGALGAPVWMALPVACDWRWMHGREDSPWYPTMRLFRQRERDNWDNVFERIARALPLRMIEMQASRETPSALDQAGAERKWQEAVQLISANQLDQAEQVLLDALRNDPHSAKVHHDLGVVRGKQRRPEHAVSSFQRSLELAPHVAGTWGNLGLALLEQDKIDEAISHLQRALTLGPNAPETFNNLGVAYMRNSQPALAAENYQRALRLRPDYAEAHLNLSRALLIQGDFEQGWLEYEWRWKCPGYHLREDPKPRWGGEPLGHRTLLLHAEQGLGDTLQFVRFASLVKRGGGTVLLECQPPLIPLLAGCPGVDQVIPQGTSVPQYDVHAPLMSLPSLLGITLSTVPAATPYLFANLEFVRTWRGKLDRIPGFKIGLSWQGNPLYDGDKTRSFELKRFAPLANLAGVRLISLQKGPGNEQSADLIDGFPVIDFGPELDTRAGSFVDTTAIMMSLDLVVTSDTAVAHLAGALGVPVWLVLPKSPDFRWLLERNDSPWYPSMRIFRQRNRGDWEEVIQRLVSELRERRTPAGAAALAPTLAAEIEASSLHEEARQEIRAGNLFAAADHLKRALRANPRFTAAHLDLGVVLARMRRFDQAIPHLRRAVELAPHQAVGYCNLGLALFESGAFDEATSVLSSGIQLDPESANLHKHFGTVLMQVGKWNEAISSFQKLVQLLPDSAEAFVRLGIAQQSAGEFAEAANSFREAVRMDPAFAEAQDRLRSLPGLAGDTKSVDPR